MRMVRAKEIICVVLTVAFIFVVTRSVPDSERSAAEVSKAVLSATDTSELICRKNGEFKKTFRLNANDYDGVVYYSSDSLMDVREILVVRLADKEQTEPLEKIVRERMEEKAVLFHGYAPDQEALLGSYVLESSRGFVCFAVCENPDKVREAFYGSL